MNRLRPVFLTLITFVLVHSLVSADVASTASVRQRADGYIVFDNQFVRISFNPDQGVWPGFDGGIQSWLFKPVNVDMVDFRALGFARNMNGHIFTIEGHPSSVFTMSRLGTDPATGAAGCVLVKEVSGQRYWLQLVLRPGSAVLEAEFGQENLSGTPRKTDLKLHHFLCPGSRDGTYQLGDVAYYPIEDGVATVTQEVHAEYPMGLFEAEEKHRFPSKPWRTKPWLNQKIPTLTGNWKTLMTPRTGDGFVFFNDPGETAQLLSWIGDDMMTMEQKTRSFMLGRGERWTMNMALAGFTGLETIAWANRFAVFEDLPHLAEGRVHCRLAGLLSGTIAARSDAGEVLAEAELHPGQPVDMTFGGTMDHFSFAVFDDAGREIGRIAPDGNAQSDLPAVAIPSLPKPELGGDVFLDGDDQKHIAELLRDRRIIVVHGQEAPENEVDLAYEIRRTFDLPISGDLMLGQETSRQGRSVLCVGTPRRNRGCDFLAGTARLMPEGWPADGKGVIRWTETFVFTGAPAVLVSARDAAGLNLAVETFLESFQTEASDNREAFTLWAGSPFERIFKYDRGDPGKALVVDTARRGFAMAYFGISAAAGSSLSEVKVTLPDARGKWPPDKSYWRELSPTIYLANYYVAGGNEDKALAWPDPLHEITTARRASPFSIPAGETRGIWISFRPSRKIRTGDIALSLAVEGDGVTTSFPFTLRVRNIVLPASSLEFQPFVHPSHVAHFNGPARPYDDRMYLRTYKTLITNLVDHGVTNFPVREFYVRGVEEDRIDLITTFVDRELDIIEREARDLPWSITVSCGKLVTEAYKMYRGEFPDLYDYSRWHWKATQSPVERLTIRALADYFRERGILDRVYAKVADEPDNFDRWLETAEVWREEGFKIHTHFNKFNDKYRKGAGKVDLWVPNYTIYTPEFYNERMAGGEKVWWYICWIPRTIVPCQLEGIRGWLWQTAKYNLQGISMWGVGCWGYHNDLYREGNGVNSMIYPDHGRGTAVHDSIRWEQVRAGIEDHKYVTRLRQAIADAEKAGREEAANEAKKGLDAVFDRLIPHSGHYNTPPEEIHRAREKVAEAMLRLENADR